MHQLAVEFIRLQNRARRRKEFEDQLARDLLFLLFDKAIPILVENGIPFQLSSEESPVGSIG